ncbi:MAG TPA: anti-sigma factor [Terriglobales bacterium]|jgi:anti-sigma-K factor RskA
MSTHEQYADDLALHAMNALEGEERLALEKHLHECASCRRELEQLRGDTALLAFSASGPKPPLRSRQRLMNAIAQEAHPREVQAPQWWSVVRWLAAAALILMGALLIRQNNLLHERIADLLKQSATQQAQLVQAKEVVATLTAPDAQIVAVVKTNTPPQPQGKAIYVRNRSSLIFIANNMPEPPARKAYELWLIPTKGAPIPAGVFKPDSHGSATVINPPLPAETEAKAFAITVEPEEGSATPTMPILMMGAGE